jgi:hypothetical protein
VAKDHTQIYGEVTGYPLDLLDEVEVLHDLPGVKLTNPKPWLLHLVQHSALGEQPRIAGVHIQAGVP